MLTQYDCLGGYPLYWSEIGTSGIGNFRPGITKVFKHNGRFFDRTIRVEDSCFALCPPRIRLKYLVYISSFFFLNYLTENLMVFILILKTEQYIFT